MRVNQEILQSLVTNMYISETQAALKSDFFAFDALTLFLISECQDVQSLCSPFLSKNISLSAHWLWAVAFNPAVDIKQHVL